MGISTGPTAALRASEGLSRVTGRAVDVVRVGADFTVPSSRNRFITGLPTYVHVYTGLYEIHI